MKFWLALLGLLWQLLRAAWSSPRTWTTGEVPGASIFNTDHRDNLIDLKQGRPISTEVRTFVDTVDRTTTSTTFVDSSTANHKVTITPTGTRVRVVFIVTASNSAANDGEFDILQFGGSRAGDATHGLTFIRSTGVVQVKIEALFTGLTAGTQYEFRLQFRSTNVANTLTIYNNAVSIDRFAYEI